MSWLKLDPHRRRNRSYYTALLKERGRANHYHYNMALKGSHNMSSYHNIGSGGQVLEIKLFYLQTGDLAIPCSNLSLIFHLLCRLIFSREIFFEE